MDEKEKDALKQATGLAKSTGVKLGAQKVGLQAKLEKARQNQSLTTDVSSKRNRIVIELDDSGSMGYDNMEMAKKAVEGFLTACNPLDTVVGVHAFSTNTDIPMTSLFPKVIADVKRLVASGGTPLYQALEKQGKISQDQRPNRIVAISDGQPDYYNTYGFGEYNQAQLSGRTHRHMLEELRSMGLTVDAVFIGGLEDTIGIANMKEIADLTGGIFIHFKDITSFKNNLRYLAPGFRGMLTSGAVSIKQIGG
jgi:Mg-chelatase subunit ChlD